ncbi:MAG TPA: hypothetical protein VGU02_00270, partial [Gaiellaceae bacterium]|nr:hypothetical protein [Gaiellaceae bacterium]
MRPGLTRVRGLRRDPRYDATDRSHTLVANPHRDSVRTVAFTARALNGTFTVRSPDFRIARGGGSDLSRVLRSLVHSRAGVIAAVGWLAFVLATQRWRPWSDGVRLQYATDVRAYEAIARAAPGFPSIRIQAPHADRWVPEWVVGEAHRLFSFELHTMYYAATGLALALAIAALVALLRQRRTGSAATALVIGAFVASAYPFRYLVEAPGMLTDALFVCGLAFAVLAFESVSPTLLVAGLVIATLGRQTGVPLLPVVAAAVLTDRRWRRRRAATAVLVVVLPLLAYLIPHETSRSFSDSSGRGLVGMTVGGDWAPRALVEHVARCAIALAIPAALLAVGWLRGRRAPLWGPLAFGLCVVAQALVLAPDWSHAEPRLAGLALPALVLAAAPSLDAAQLGIGEAATAAIGIALASLHHL